METRVKVTNLTQQFKTNLSNFWGESFAANILGCESISTHNIALSPFDNEIWFNKWQQIIQHSTSSLPIVNGSSEFLLTSPSISRIFRATKSIFKPYYEFLVAASYSQEAMPLKAAAIFALFNIAYIQTAFAVNESCKISYLPNLMICTEFNYFSHEFPFVYNSLTINEYKINGERLSEKTSKEDAIV